MVKKDEIFMRTEVFIQRKNITGVRWREPVVPK